MASDRGRGQRGTKAAFFGLLLSGLSGPAFAADIPLPERRSGYEFMGPGTRAMQDDDTQNPATLAVLEGQSLWARKAGAADRACTDCHGDARESMKGVAARYPKFDGASARPIDLEGRIMQCRAVDARQHQVRQFGNVQDGRKSGIRSLWRPECRFQAHARPNVSWLHQRP